MAIVTWNGKAGDGLWGTGGNWDSGSAPVSGEDVVLPTLSSAYTVSLDTTEPGSGSFNSLTIDNGVTLQMGGETLSATTISLAGLAFLEGHGTVNGALSGSGLITATGGALTFTGDVTGTTGLDIGGSATLLLNGGSNSASQATFLGSGGTLEIGAGASLTLTNAFDASANTLKLDSSSSQFTDSAGITLGGNGLITGTGTINAAINGGSSASGVITASGGALTINGAIDASGSASTLEIASGSTLDLAGNVGVNGTIQPTLQFLAGAGIFQDTAVTQGSVDLGTISGFTGSDQIQLQAFGSGDHATVSGDTLTISNAASTLSQTYTFSSAANLGWFHQNGSVDELTACFMAGALIRTPDGEAAVETMKVGDLVVTASGALRPLKWIGSRAYSARFAGNNRDLLPIRFKAGSLAEGVPTRDLLVSPKHAMFLDGVLIPAEHLVNGATIAQEPPGEDIHYFHLELETHDVLIAEGAFSESFVDDDSRSMFQNAHEFRELYPDERPKEARYCKPRVEHGFALDRVRRRLAARAGLGFPAATDFGNLVGVVERCDHEGVSGWAFNTSFPNAPVCLDVTIDGAFAGYAYAETERPNGDRSFDLRFASPLDPSRPHEIELRRSADGALLGRRLIPAIEAA
jgi:Hint domain